MPSTGLKGWLRDERVAGEGKAKSRSVDNVAEESGFDESVELVITEADDSTQLSDCQKCTCYVAG